MEKIVKVGQKDISRQDFPVLNTPSPDSSSVVLTRDVLDRAMAYYLSPEYAESLHRAQERAFREQQANWERIERRWADIHGVSELTPELREKLDEAAWQWMVEHTNIEEILG